MSTSRSLRQPSAARANSVKSRSDLQIASSRRARPAPAQLMPCTRAASAFASRALAAAAVAPSPTASASSPGALGVPAIVLRLARGRLAVREDFASHRGSRCHQRRRARWRAPSRERKDSLDTIA